MVFLVPTVVMKSPIEGYGVFTTVPIKKGELHDQEELFEFLLFSFFVSNAGTRIWAFAPGADWEVTQEEMDKFPEPFKTRLLIWAYKDKRGIWILCNDNAKFMNHSSTPNCDDVSDPIYTIAARDIAPGEELTCDYGGFHHGEKLF